MIDLNLLPTISDSEAGFSARLRAGDGAAYEALVQRCTPRLLAVAGRFLRSPEDRADAVQEALLRAYRSRQSFEGKARVSTWLHRIVVNVCLMKLRRRSRRAAEVPLDDSLHEAGASPGHGASRLASAETQAQVRACIERLPESYRTVVVLRDLEELDTDQTARRIGATHGVVKTRLHRARRALRRLLAPLVGYAPSPAALSRALAPRS
jgi:RNA polymerase sigma-70 factor, ECF subfamily